MFNNATNCGYSLSDIAAITGRNNSGFGDGNGWWIILLFLFILMGNGWDDNGMRRIGGGGGSSSGTATREAIYYGFDMNNLENGIRGIQNGICDGFYAMNTGMLNMGSGLQTSIANGFHGVDNAICNLGYQTAQLANGITNNMNQNTNAINTQLTNGFTGVTAGLTALGTQLASCCCETGRQIERGFCDTNYNMATNTRDIVQSTHNDTDRILARLDLMETNRLQDKIATLTSENQALKFSASQCAQNAYLVDQLGAKTPSPCYVVPNPYCNCNTNSCCNNY